MLMFLKYSKYLIQINILGKCSWALYSYWFMSRDTVIFKRWHNVLKTISFVMTILLYYNIFCYDYIIIIIIFVVYS